ncbi:unnamed protein product [Ceratitis capitata]|uniref:(Mediterranean fruit fly) hypothetical protein n=1 Tax=Ceratitis capitata TaxID=7213 RepID=A0A811UYS7_CERCA|nr:unnamed protein product [Ceratitis capitata]
MAMFKQQLTVQTNVYAVALALHGLLHATKGRHTKTIRTRKTDREVKERYLALANGTWESSKELDDHPRRCNESILQKIAKHIVEPQAIVVSSDDIYTAVVVVVVQQGKDKFVVDGAY